MRRYGPLKMFRFDPEREVLVKPIPVSVTVENVRDVAGVREQMTALVQGLRGRWLRLDVRERECGCGGDAFSGLIPCDAHMSADGHPFCGTDGRGLWWPAATSPSWRARRGWTVAVARTHVDLFVV